MASRSESPEPLSDDQAGVSLVEIVVAMFLLAVMSVAVLPLMIGAVQASATNRDLVAASSFANAQLDTLQTTYSNSKENSCAAVVANATSGVLDPSKSGVTASISFGACPSLSNYPGTVTVRVQAFRLGSAKAALTLDSAILVAKP